MTTLLEVSAQLEPLVYKVARFPDPAHSGAEVAEVLARISLLVFGRIPTTEETQRLGVLMGHCLAAGKLLSLPSPPRHFEQQQAGLRARICSTKGTP